MSLDTISNMLSMIKNASMAGRPFVEFSHSKMCENIAKIFHKEGFLGNVKIFKPKDSNRKMLHLDLIYTDGIPSISDIKRVSKPGRRIYKGNADIGFVAGGYGISVLSTSKGVMTGKAAQKKRLGGEILCEVR